MEVERDVEDVTTRIGEESLEEDLIVRLKELYTKREKLLLEKEEDCCIKS